MVVVDTNVAMVASGHAPQADDSCVNTCVQRLWEIMKNGGLLVDEHGLILHEYTRRLGHAGQPGAGEKFAKWAFTNQATPPKVTQVAINRCDEPGWRQFVEFPDLPELAGFDTDDQKFVAVAIASGRNPPILNAVDSDWWNAQRALNDAGVTIEFLCPQHAPR
ncbi:MAG: hypothetical protein H6818_10540 [Phycisphaerales bacterium]|nr:hypothetical protein [Phycisphaerales bacterium]